MSPRPAAVFLHSLLFITLLSTIGAAIKLQRRPISLERGRRESTCLDLDEESLNRARRHALSRRHELIQRTVQKSFLLSSYASVALEDQVAPVCTEIDNLNTLQILRRLHNALNGPNWVIPKGMNNWLTNTSMRTWAGLDIVNCTVTLSLLGELNCTGELTEDLWQIPQLLGLHIDQTLISGTLPEMRIEYLPYIINLRSVGLAQNPVLSGTVPHLYKNLPNFQSLYIESNVLSGTIHPFPEATRPSVTQLTLYQSNLLTYTLPTDMSSFRNLHTLLLDGKNIRGTMASNFDQASNLNLVIVNSPLVSGTVPPLDHLSSLFTLLITSRSLSGTMPDLTPLSQLQYLSLSEGSWTGPPPPALPSLTYYELSFTMFDGSLDSNLFHLPHLTHLVVSYAGPTLGGSLPPMWNSSQLAVVDLFALPRLSGTLSEMLASLPSLVEVQVSLCPLVEGVMPPFGVVPTALTQLTLTTLPLLSGTISDHIGALTALQTLRLTFLPRLSGTLSRSFADLVSLNVLSLGLLDISGQLPELGAPNMQSIELTDCDRLSGSMPAYWNITSLRTMKVIDNDKLAGHFPGFAPLSSLVFLQVSSVLMSGEFPTRFDRLPNLEVLQIEAPHLIGTISESINTLTHLRILQVEKTKVSGTLPPLRNLTALTSLIVSNNHVSGTLQLYPEWSSLYELRVEHNALSGTVDPVLCQLHNLSRLYITSNQFSGPIPDCQVHKLYEFQAGHNSLDHLPAAFMQSPRLEILNMSTNAITLNSTNCLSNNFNSLVFLELSYNPINASFHDFLDCYLSTFLSQLLCHHCLLNGKFDSPSTIQHDDTAFVRVSELSRILFLLSRFDRYRLSYMDIRGNAVSGSIYTNLQAYPPWDVLSAAEMVFDYFPFLSTIKFEDTLISVENPDILSLSGRSLIDANTLMTCPIHTLQRVGVPISLEAPSNFVGFKQCTCSPKHYWDEAMGVCRECPPHKPLVCDPSVVAPHHQVDVDFYPIIPQSCGSDPVCLIHASYVKCRQPGVCSVADPYEVTNTVELVSGFQCANGYDESRLLCSYCEPNFFRINFECRHCQDWFKWVLPVLLVGICLAYAALLGYKFSQSLRAATFSIAVFFVQLVSVLDLNGSPTSNSFTTQTAMFRPWALECVFPSVTPYHLEMALLLPLYMPVVALALVWLFDVARGKLSTAELLHKAVFVVTYTWELCYIPVSAAVFQSLTCQHVVVEGHTREFLARAPFRSCSDTFLTAAANITLIYFVVGFPLVTIWALHPARSRHTRHGLSLNLRFLTAPSRVWWWQPVVLRVRAFLVTLIQFTLPFESDTIPILVFVVVLLSILLQVYLSPYEWRGDNLLSVLTMMSALLLYLSSVVDKSANSSSSFIGAFVLAIYIITLVVCVLVTMQRCRVSMRRKSTQFVVVDGLLVPATETAATDALQTELIAAEDPESDEYIGAYRKLT